jgi:ribonuclease VapC
VIIDTSVLVAIFRDDADAPAYLQAVQEHRARRLSAASYLEAGIIADRSADPIQRQRLDQLLALLAITIEPVSAAQARIARQAYRDFGKGSGSQARLNYGDCFAYALARERNEPLLFKGSDFDKTDIPMVGRRAERRRIQELLAAYG